MNIRIIVGLTALLAAPWALAGDPVEDARHQVDRLNSTLIQVMKDAKTLGYKGRYQKLEPVVREAFEFESVSQIALGSHWKKLDPQQKAAFISKISELSVATYAAQFNGYGGESFKFENGQDQKNGRMLLRYVMEAPKEKPVKFEYMVSEQHGKWEIINIIVDGISDLALKKAQYTSVIDREGFDSLLNKLTQKIADYATSNSSPS